MIELVKPTKENMAALEIYKANIAQSEEFHGVSDLNIISVDEWLQQCEDHSRGINLPDGFVPSSQFVAIRDDGKIVGSINIRHELNEHLLNSGGHIGYMVAPDERKKGYAKEILRLGLIKCKKLDIYKVLVTCKKSNLYSAKVVIANGGVLENEIPYKGDILQRYWINLTKEIKL